MGISDCGQNNLFKTKRATTVKTYIIIISFGIKFRFLRKTRKFNWVSSVTKTYSSWWNSIHVHKQLGMIERCWILWRITAKQTWLPQQFSVWGSANKKHKCSCKYKIYNVSVSTTKQIIYQKGLHGVSINEFLCEAGVNTSRLVS